MDYEYKMGKYMEKYQSLLDKYSETNQTGGMHMFNRDKLRQIELKLIDHAGLEEILRITKDDLKKRGPDNFKTLGKIKTIGDLEKFIKTSGWFPDYSHGHEIFFYQNNTITKLDKKQNIRDIYPGASTCTLQLYNEKTQYLNVVIKDHVNGEMEYTLPFLRQRYNVIGLQVYELLKKLTGILPKYIQSEVDRINLYSKHIDQPLNGYQKLTINDLDTLEVSYPTEAVISERERSQERKILEQQEENRTAREETNKTLRETAETNSKNLSVEDREITRPVNLIYLKNDEDDEDGYHPIIRQDTSRYDQQEWRGNEDLPIFPNYTSYYKEYKFGKSLEDNLTGDDVDLIAWYQTKDENMRLLQGRRDLSPEEDQFTELINIFNSPEAYHRAYPDRTEARDFTRDGYQEKLDDGLFTYYKMLSGDDHNVYRIDMGEYLPYPDGVTTPSEIPNTSQSDTALVTIYLSEYILDEDDLERLL